MLDSYLKNVSLRGRCCRYFDTLARGYIHTSVKTCKGTILQHVVAPFSEFKEHKKLILYEKNLI